MGAEDSGEQPFVALPDKIDDDPRNGLMCFLNDARPCGAECMAFSTQPAQSQTLGLQARHCTLLVEVERLSRHVVIATKLLNDALQMQRKNDEDRRRGEQRPPPVPR